MGATAIWCATLLNRVPDWTPWLHDVVLIGGGLLAIAPLFPLGTRRVAVVIASSAAVVCLAAPAAWTLATVGTSHRGAIPTSGPAGATRGGFGGGPGGGGFPGGGFPGGGQIPPNTNGGTNAFPGGGVGPATRGGGGIGGLLNGSQVSDQVADFLRDGSSGYRWVAAAVGANNAASYQLASDEAIMAIGGFNGSDPAPTLAEFQRYVDEGRIHYFIAGGGFGGGPGGGGNGTTSEISSWVSSHFKAVTVGGVTFYDLTQEQV